jgi:hypothetical protein
MDILKDIIGEKDVSKEFFDTWLYDIKQQLLDEKKAIEEDQNTKKITKKWKMLLLNIKKSISEKTLGIKFEDWEREWKTEIEDNEDDKKDDTTENKKNKTADKSEKRDWIEANSIQNLLMIEKIKTNKELFAEKIIQIGKNLNINANWIMWIMHKESWLNHQAVNKKSWATGLIQFMPDTAKRLWTTTKSLKNMSNIEQLEFVEKYFKPYTNKIKSHTDLYLATFYPAAIGKSEDFIIGSEVSEKRARIIGKQNNINNGNPIRVKDVNAWISKWIPEAYKREISSDEQEKMEYKNTLLVGDSHVWWIKIAWYQWETKYFNGYDTGQIYEKLIAWDIDIKEKDYMILYTWSNDITKNKINTLAENMRKIKDFLDSKGVKLVVTKIPYNKSKQKETIDQVNNIIETFAADNTINMIDLHTNIEIKDNEYAGDGVHLNNNWYQKITDEIKKYMTA